jgi:hemerythrin-like domain-containing protein
MAQLERCHRRLEEACEALANAVRDHDLETIGDVCAFFGRQIRRHEMDEESSLFPRLRGAADAKVVEALEKLSADHRDHEGLHTELERLLSGRGDDAGPEAMWRSFATVAETITQAYQAHVELEEAVVFPAARALLSPTMLDEIAGEMEERRGRGRA